ncbi:hypothetical protein [Bacillus sp. FSL K6-0268]|uniref:hypothetical protein n=1 Tax=Bacillus sp. FSL K6-0268 TaxID=2921449 RepID=UPI0030FB8B4B
MFGKLEIYHIILYYIHHTIGVFCIFIFTPVFLRNKQKTSTKGLGLVYHTVSNGPTGPAGPQDSGTLNNAFITRASAATLAANTPVVYENLLIISGTDIQFTPPSDNIILDSGQLYLVNYQLTGIANGFFDIALFLNDAEVSGTRIGTQSTTTTGNIASGTAIIDTRPFSVPTILTLKATTAVKLPTATGDPSYANTQITIIGLL